MLSRIDHIQRLSVFSAAIIAWTAGTSSAVAGDWFHFHKHHVSGGVAPQGLLMPNVLPPTNGQVLVQSQAFSTFSRPNFTGFTVAPQAASGTYYWVAPQAVFFTNPSPNDGLDSSTDSGSQRQIGFSASSGSAEAFASNRLSRLASKLNGSQRPLNNLIGRLRNEIRSSPNSLDRNTLRDKLFNLSIGILSNSLFPGFGLEGDDIRGIGQLIDGLLFGGNSPSPDDHVGPAPLAPGTYEFEVTGPIRATATVRSAGGGAAGELPELNQLGVAKGGQQLVAAPLAAQSDEFKGLKAELDELKKDVAKKADKADTDELKKGLANILEEMKKKP